MKKYLYKQIILFKSWGTWQADIIADGKRFALHRHCSRTKAIAYELAKFEVDCMNERS